MTAFAQNLKRLMRKTCQTQKSIAQGIGVSEATVSYWMSGEREPLASNVYALAKRHGLTMDALMNDPLERHIAELDLAAQRHCWDIVIEQATKLQALEEELG
jgi:transcriptional regulator with XRE-family HTH domain